MAITYQSSVLTSEGTITEVARPTGVANGDCIIITMGQVGASPADCTIAGFTLLVRTTIATGGGGSVRTSVYWRISDGTDGATYAITGSSGYARAIAVRYSGTKSTSPIQTYTTAVTNTDSPHSNAGLTPVVTGGKLVHAGTNYFASNPAWSNSATLREHGGGLVSLADKDAPASGVATGALTATSGAGAMTSVVLVLDPPDNFAFSGDGTIAVPSSSGTLTVVNPTNTLSGNGTVSAPTSAGSLTSTAAGTRTLSGGGTVSAPTSAGSLVSIAPDMPPAWSIREQLYERLPEAWIYDDERGGYPLWSWLYPVLTGAEEVAQFVMRTSRGELTNPALADASWLRWLAQVSGIVYPEQFLDVADVRTWLQRPERHERGSHRSMATRVALELGGVTVQVYGHWRTNPWIVVVRTSEAETPLSGVPVASWADLMTIAPTWADLIEEGPEVDIHTQDEVRVTIARTWARPEKAAGVRMGHRWARQYAPGSSDSFYQNGPDWP